jgi:hypothetical protein
MHRNDSGAFGIHVYGAVEEHEASSDWRRDQVFRLVEAGNDSTLHSPPTLFDTTPSEEMEDPRPITAIKASTVTYYTADQFTETQSTTVSTGVTQPSTKNKYFHYEKTPYYSLHWESDTPNNKTPYHSLHWESDTPDTKISYNGISLEVLIFSAISVPAIHSKLKKFQDFSAYQVVVKFFPHYSHPPYY